MEKKARQKEGSSCDNMCVGRNSRSHCLLSESRKDEHCYQCYFGQVPCPWHSVYQEIRIQSMCRITILSLVYPFRFILFSFMCVCVFVRVLYRYVSALRSQKRLILSEARVTHSCKMFHLGAKH